MHDAMVDLETWGVRPGCALRSIAAVMFDPYSEKVGAEFYANIEDGSCDKWGLVVDPQTKQWWEGPKNAKAAGVFAKDQVPLIDALQEFALWWKRHSAVYFWSQGGNYDDPVLAYAYHACSIKAPWRFFESRCTRTAYHIGRLNPFHVKREGVAHYALDDAKYQIKCVQRAMRGVRQP